MTEPMRIQRALARAGVASRRAAEELVAAGRVTVNGTVAKTGQSVEPEEMPARIRLVNEKGDVVPGAAGQYHSHAFYPDPGTGDVPNAVMTGNLLSRGRTDVALVISPQEQKRRSRGAQLPQVS